MPLRRRGHLSAAADNLGGMALAFLRWLGDASTPKVFFAGMTPILRFINPPAPHVEVGVLEEGSIENIRSGELLTDIPEGGAFISSLHFGNFSPVKAERGRAWCVIFDTSTMPAPLASELSTHPLFTVGRCADLGEMVNTFKRLRRLCARQGFAPSDYRRDMAMYDPAGPALAPGVEWRVRAALLDLLGILADTPEGSGGEEATPESVATTLAVIEERFTDPGLTLALLARTACLSVDHFGRLFKTHAGAAPMAYVQRRRLREAALLLRQTGHKIEQIALSVGYPDPLYFSRLFKKEFGQGPRDFRRCQQCRPPSRRCNTGK